ncbi:arrestin-C-like [Conger conger]|uniref:arrestin-C-like n=1 Tax=Conger conger TaxID=82655 RepID=UPI002A5A6B33|nr:arrestin-C-like [Conger conger]
MSKVFKKTSGNGQMTLYMGRRDFVDHVDHVEPVDCVLKIDPSSLGGKKAWVYLCCAFRYGREDMDVIGLSFRKDIWTQRKQIYPPLGDQPTPTPTQETLMKKAGEHSYPVTFKMPNNLPCSVTLQPGTGDKGKACGVDFEVKAYIANEADNADEKISKKDACRLIIRKIQFAPDNTGSGPKADICKQFMMSDKPVHLEASIEKELYYHGDPIPVKVKIQNESNKVVKQIKVCVDQTADVVLYSADKYNKTVLTEEFSETVEPNGTLEKVLNIIPSLANNKEKSGLALDGKLKYEDTCLASTTILRPDLEKEVLGILVSYKIRVSLMASRGGLLGDLTASDISVELPLVLMHPKPAGKYPNIQIIGHNDI